VVIPASLSNGSFVFNANVSTVISSVTVLSNVILNVNGSYSISNASTLVIANGTSTTVQGDFISGLDSNIIIEVSQAPTSVQPSLIDVRGCVDLLGEITVDLKNITLNEGEFEILLFTGAPCPGSSVSSATVKIINPNDCQESDNARIERNNNQIIAIFKIVDACTPSVALIPFVQTLASSVLLLCFR
jgi:hypothetical protein